MHACIMALPPGRGAVSTFFERFFFSEKRFRRSVGSTLKQDASIVRLRRAVEAYGTGRSLTKVSLDAGYCDQSHFIRHFRLGTGEAPRRFLASAEYC